MRMRRVPGGSLPVRSAVMVRAPPAGNPRSSMTRTHFSVPSLTFDGSTRASTYGAKGRRCACSAAYMLVEQVRLLGGIHAGRRVVFDLAMHEQPQRAAAVGLAEIKFQAVRFGESHE